MSEKQVYMVYFIEKRRLLDLNQEIQYNEDEIKKEFAFDDFYSSKTIRNLKEYFLSNFGHIYKLCTCQLYLFRFISRVFSPSTLAFINENDSKKLSEIGHNNLYLIKNKDKCDCELNCGKENYFNKTKYELIQKINSLIQENEELKFFRTRENALMKQLKDITFKIGKYIELDYRDPKKFYDVIVDIKSIIDIKKGWKVIMSENGKQKYEKFKNEKILKLGVIGNSKSGKSFLLSKISKVDLISGTSIQTNGLSIKYPDNRKLILLDSFGMEKPVFKNDINNNKDKIDEKNEYRDYIERRKDKILTELFLQNFIVKYSDILIIVVGNMTFSEQILIDKIKEESKNKRDKIFIIHNLQSFRTIEQVEDYINNTLYKCFNLEKKKPIDYIENKKKENNNKKEIKINNIIEEDNKIINKKKENEIILDEKSVSNYNLLGKSNSLNEINLGDINNINIKINQKNKNNNNDSEIINDKINDKINDYNDKNNIINLKDNDINININKNENDDKDDEKIINNKIENNIEDNNKINKKEKNKYNNTELLSTYYSEVLKYDDKKKIDIYHLILANEDSDAGLFYNNYTYNFFNNFYDISTELKNFDVFEEIKNEFKIIAPNLIAEKIENINFNDNKDIINNKIIKLNLEKEVTLKDFNIGECVPLFNINSFQPKYNYFKLDENTLEIRLEIPGNANCVVEKKIENNQTLLIINGEKKPDKDPKKLEDNIVNLRTYTDFQVVIPLSCEKFQISSGPLENPEFKSGLCIIKLKLDKNNKKAEAESNEV